MYPVNIIGADENSTIGVTQRIIFQSDVPGAVDAAAPINTVNTIIGPKNIHNIINAINHPVFIITQ